MSPKGKEIMITNPKTSERNHLDLSGSRKRVADNVGLDDCRDVSPPPGFTRAHRYISEPQMSQKGKEIIITNPENGKNNLTKGWFDMNKKPECDGLGSPPGFTPPRRFLSGNTTTEEKKKMQHKELVVHEDVSFLGMTPFTGQNWGHCSQSQLALSSSSKKEPSYNDICRKIVYLLGKNYQELVNSGDLMELIKLTKLLQADQTLNIDQVTLLKVVGEIPTMVKNYDELAELREKVKCLSNKLKKDVTNSFDMKKNYNCIIGEMEKVQSELDAENCAIREIDDHISTLQRRRFEIYSSAKGKRDKLVQLETTKKEARDALTHILDDVKVGKKKTQETEMRKNVVEENNVAILARLAKYRNVPFALF